MHGQLYRTISRCSALPQFLDGVNKKPGVAGFLFLLMRSDNQLEHLDVDDKESVNLPNQECPHEAGKSRWRRSVVSLLVWFSVGGDIVHVLFHVNLWLINPVSKTSPGATWLDR